MADNRLELEKIDRSIKSAAISLDLIALFLMVIAVCSIIQTCSG